MRAELDVDLAHPELADSAGTQERIRADLIALQRLVDDLLALAAIDEERSTASRSVDLDDVVFREVASLRATPGSHDRHVRGDRGARARSRDPALTVVANLLENAATTARRPSSCASASRTAKRCSW